jgi:hypothetical protein
MKAQPLDFEVLFHKRDEALREQSEQARTDLSNLMEECEGLRVLQELLAESAQEPVVTYTRA